MGSSEGDPCAHAPSRLRSSARSSAACGRRPWASSPRRARARWPVRRVRRPSSPPGPPSSPPPDSPTSPPPGPPSSPPGQQVDQGIELVDGLGNGGQPEGLPREVVIADARFLFDRIVPLSRQELFRVAQEQETIAYARTEEGPFAAIYVSVPNRSEDELARYLPEGVGSADVSCPAEAGEYERVDASGSLYAFAGIETDLTADVAPASRLTAMESRSLRIPTAQRRSPSCSSHPVTDCFASSWWATMAGRHRSPSRSPSTAPSSPSNPMPPTPSTPPR